MLVLTLQFLGGLLLLLGGGESLVRGAGTIARGLGVPPVAVGLTVVAFGTSAPEFVVAVTGAATGSGGIAFGNVVGANIINIAFILGLTAVIHPLIVHPTIITRELPMLLLAMCAAIVLSMDQLLDGNMNMLQRGDGLILCLLFAVFLYYSVMALRKTGADEFVDAAEAVGWRLRVKSMLPSVGLVLAGLVGLAIGGSLLVSAAVDMAGQLGMTPAAVGLTIVAIGTTFPELATSLLAARKGEADLAIGNIVGSNIFNILLVLGTASAVAPFEVPARGPVTLAIGTGLTLLLMLLIHTGKRRIHRIEGLLLLGVFVSYMAWVLISTVE
jgi:cation:H+ antiporter